MQLASLDWIVIAIYGVVTVGLGLYFTRRASKSVDDYFVAGRSLPWWLAGTSIAATWFASDAPLAAASLVRQHGIFANWLWWYEAGGILLLVFFYAKLWRRAEVITDAEFIELRYGGKPASWLRGFTAVYHGILRNCVVMGWVMLAMVKFSQVLLGWDAATTLIVCVTLALLYTIASGLWGVVATDLLQFITGMIGSFILAGIVLHTLGGGAEMTAQIKALSDAPEGVLDLVPKAKHLSGIEFASYMCLLLVLWMRSGHDGYMAQRLFATKDDKQAVLAALWFAFAGMVMTWPWIVAGLGSLIIFPVATAAPELAADPELAYPMMIAELMPVGLRGMLVAAFLAAFMSTMDTHLCWGASYLVTDIYKRFIKKAEDARHYVVASRVGVLILVVLAAITAWQMESIERAWVYIIELTAGIALVNLLRWYWWRVNAWAEISAMIGSVIIANGRLWASILEAMGLLSDETVANIAIFYGDEYNFVRATMVLVLCSIIWIGVTLLTRPTPMDRLEAFYRRVRPGGWWGPVAERCPEVPPDVPATTKWIGWFFGLLFVYGALLGVGYWVLGQPVVGIVLLALSAVGGLGALAVTRKAISS